MRVGGVVGVGCVGVCGCVWVCVGVCGVCGVCVGGCVVCVDLAWAYGCRGERLCCSSR